ncbi:CRP/FNR family transcriptional regulator [Hyphomicrobium denitrificans 1NES1]|uniref:CRP/FNR family transcriptional regulator n=1 Tax=Hyphomicrobium denitrificans 1NES1 TaxID=670307 RepID=N0B776_9HYPH|nr:Crp/Fnr family transcriptional regulator [Hyphomicrobium denitrificans]AGK56396.1 CRP/FNR family transcriptional regulator [Hyphomicrobium denitrificans 1NES1]
MIAHTAVATLSDDLLAQLPYFTGLDRRILKEIARAVRRRTFAAGETILAEGKPCEGLYFVIQGQVRLTRGSAVGRGHVLRVLGPGATFNEVAVFDGGPNSDSAVAVGATTVGLIPKGNVIALIERDPQVAKAALQLMSSRQRALGNIVEDLALRDVTSRVARLLLGCMGQHMHVVEQAPDACASITHQEIASMVGSVREVVQRALKELERDGAIALERSRIRIRDQAKLEHRAHLSV